MQYLSFWLPAVIYDLHVHGRDMLQDYKTTVLQVLKEAFFNLISVVAFMPNTKPEITTIVVLRDYLKLINRAKRKLGVTQTQFIWFGVTNDNLEECKKALKFPEVIGLKVYSELEITDQTIRQAMLFAKAAGKVVAVHCDDPKIIKKKKYCISAEVSYVRKIISLAKTVPGIKVMICHVSCRQSAELILSAQKTGMQIAIEICIHYLFFDAGKTNKRKDLHKNFYLCLNRLRQKSDREFFINKLLKSNNRLIMVHSDSACHNENEKLQGFNGLPSNQELVSGLVTLAIQNKISQNRVAQLLSFNAADFFGFVVPRRLVKHQWILKPNNNVYNYGVVINPWAGLMMYQPVRNAGG